MEGYLFAVGSAVWLGILTSISPCPLASNIAAISYLGQQVDSPRKVLISGLLYTLGRTISYLAVGILVTAGLLAVYDISYFLQKYSNLALGPILLTVGLFLIGLFKFKTPGIAVSDKIKTTADRMGLWGALFLGLIFALSFCPVSAAIFFGSLIPLAVKHQSTVTIPVVYGIGTALPVFVFAFMIAGSAKYVGNLFDKLNLIQKYARIVTGIIFILVGVYYTLIYIFKVPL